MENDSILTLILHGCELARKLEGGLPTVVNQPNLITESCDEIIRAFMAVRDGVNDHQVHNTSPFLQHSIDQEKDSDMPGVELLKYPKGFDQHMMETQSHVHDDFIAKMISSMPYEQNQVACERMGAGGGVAKAVGGSRKCKTYQSSGSSRPESSTRPIRRNKRDGRRTVRMAAPKIGNAEIPPEDGFTWRKYGQKEILGSRFPRAYFRCTHQKLYNCQAKKQVQRLDDDPTTFELTYITDHTCHMSATAPGPSTSRVPLLKPIQLTTVATSGTSFVPAISQLSTPSSTWLSMGIGCPMSTLCNAPFIDPQQHSYSMLHGNDTCGYNYQSVTDMADVMFNFGSSAYTSMDQLISSTVETKWHQGS